MCWSNVLNKYEHLVILINYLLKNVTMKTEFPSFRHFTFEHVGREWRMVDQLFVTAFTFTDAH